MSKRKYGNLVKPLSIGAIDSYMVKNIDRSESVTFNGPGNADKII